MAFPLSRGGANVPAEVQRWQYFLLKRGFPQVGAIDADFGAKTEMATRFFQTQQNLTVSGAVDQATLDVAAQLGYAILPNNYYKLRNKPSWPPKPAGLESPSNAWRNGHFTCFKFKQLKRQHRPDAESIVVGGSCDGQFPDWTGQFIVDIEIKQLQFAAAYNGYVRCHRLAVQPLIALFDAWEKANLLHLIVKYEGCYVPRYKRNKSPGDAAQPERRSADVEDLSNHSFGSALDMNYDQNEFPAVPALCGEFGSTRELVEAAAIAGFYWGGYFKDGNHFELARI